MPILLAPGTASIGSTVYAGNFVKLMQNSTAFDPIPMDIPDNLLGDVQVNAEYHAYAINYVGSITNRQVGMVTWSQGSLNMQWALKYWPSTRPVVSDFVAISGDLNGTNVGSVDAVQGTVPAPAALFQQESDAVFIKTIRNNGGDSAYVPTTSIYSNTDQVISPQNGTDASAFFKADNGVPANNYEVQTICANQAAGGNFSHGGMLCNSFAIAVAMDAFSNPGPGDASRLDLARVCSFPVAEGLNVMDQAATMGAASGATSGIGLAVGSAASGDVMLKEPAIKAYAVKDRPAGYKAPNLFSTLGSAAKGILKRRGVVVVERR